jgi:hypothetical protein
MMSVGARTQHRHTVSLLMRLSLSLSIGFATMVGTAVVVNFLAWRVVDLVVDSAGGFGSAGSVVSAVAVVVSFAAAAGVGSFVFAASSRRNSVYDEPRPSEAVAAGAGLSVVITFGWFWGAAFALLPVAPFVLFGGLIGARRNEPRGPSAPQPEPFELLEAV